jgi:2,3-bisphosphoglycerate-independent phosphoglycerate mutase
MIVDKKWNGEYEINPSIENPGLANIASTVVNLLGYKSPSGYEPSLIRFR